MSIKTHLIFMTLLMTLTTACKVRNSTASDQSGGTSAYYLTQDGQQEIKRINAVVDLDTSSPDVTAYFLPDVNSTPPLVEAGRRLYTDKVPTDAATFSASWNRYLNFVILKDKYNQNLQQPLVRNFRIKLYMDEVTITPSKIAPSTVIDYTTKYSQISDSMFLALNALTDADNNAPPLLSRQCPNPALKTDSILTYSLDVRGQSRLARSFLALASLGFYDQTILYKDTGPGGLLAAGIPSKTADFKIIESPFLVRAFANDARQPKLDSLTKSTDYGDINDGVTSQSRVETRVNKTTLPTNEFGALTGLAFNLTSKANDRLFGAFRVGFDTFRTAAEVVYNGVDKAKVYPEVFGLLTNTENFDWNNYINNFIATKDVAIPRISCVEIIEDPATPFDLLN